MDFQDRKRGPCRLAAIVCAIDISVEGTGHRNKCCEQPTYIGASQGADKPAPVGQPGGVDTRTIHLILFFQVDDQIAHKLQVFRNRDLAIARSCPNPTDAIGIDEESLRAWLVSTSWARYRAD